MAKLLKLCRAESPVCVTGGLAADTGLLAALRKQIEKDKSGLEVIAPKNAIHAGAIGAALWGAYRAVRAPKKEAVHAAR